MNKPKGGRGIQAPYETTHVRVPVPLKKEIENFIEQYREFVMNGTLEPNIEITDLYEIMNLSPKTRWQAETEAKKILAQKKSARISLEKLLTVLYNEEIKL